MLWLVDEEPAGKKEEEEEGKMGIDDVEKARFVNEVVSGLDIGAAEKASNDLDESLGGDDVGEVL